MDVLRLDRFLSAQVPGLSRSDAKEAVRRGKVSVNGALARSAEQKIDPAADTVALCGEPVGYKKFLYIMLNKPQGVVCATRDGLSETVLSLLPESLRRRGLFPAGRLDKDAVGFVFITDDGALAHRLLAPKSHVPKTYFVRLRDAVPDGARGLFERGIVLDGEKCLPAELKKLSSNECELTLHQGKYHQIKRMFQSLGNEVVYLKRLSFGGILLDPALSEGECRELSPKELEILKKC